MRMLFIGAEGYRGDVSSFMAWALTAAQHPLWQFYDKAGFADYPPGYLFVLWLAGHIYLLLPHAQGDYSLLHFLVKLPACAFDIVNGALIYWIVRRFASEGWALGAAAIYVFNPATIYISAYWGQVDAVPGAFLLAAIGLLLYAPHGDARRARLFTILAWLAVSYAILIKPPAVMAAIVMVVWAFAVSDAVERARRLRNTSLGVVAGLILAYVVALIFHPSFLGAIPWLFERYAFGSAVYPYNSVNAFNLHSLFRPFWQPDTTTVAFAPMYVWGILLVVAATVLILTRYLQRRDDLAFLEAAMLVSLAFFVLATRMHERYVFNAFVLLVPLAAVALRYRIATAALSVTLLANLWYSLYYARAMDAKWPIDATDIFPWLVHPMSAIVVATFFALGYLYLGRKAAEVQPRVSAPPGLQDRAIAWIGRAWFSPAQGLAMMTRADWIILGGFTLLAFVIDFMWYWNPNERYFDEIYYPRSGIEYLKGVRINTDWEYPFEWTHPPLTKLLIAASIWLFGGVAHGDNGWGWRFLNVVCGTLMVPLCYLFAKRLCASTLFSSAAAFMLTFDGFRFVQSRIATPEIWVATFGLAVLYAFYRLWTAAQVRIRIHVPAEFGWQFWIVLAAGTACAGLFSYGVNHLGATPPDGHSYAFAFVYGELAAYLLARWVGRRFTQAGPTVVSYAEGSRVVLSGDERRLIRFDDEEGAGSLQFDDLQLNYKRDGSLAYKTPEGAASFTPDGSMQTGESAIKASDASTWVVATCILMALLAASKWNGLFDLAVLLIAVIVVFLQRFVRAPAVFGNPRGLTPDAFVVGMIFVMATMYFACYIPNYRLGYNFPDIVGMQYQMFWYHDQLSKNNPASLHHPYGSYWWQWPTLFAPISYYWHDWRTGAAASKGAACCVAEILALPNPLVWWFGLFSVPAMAWWGWTERNKGYVLLFGAYLFQWLPWILTPRIAFEYHFFPNLPIIVLANAVVLQRWWKKEENRFWIGLYLIGVLGCFIFFYPVLAAMPITYDQWHQRMWLDNWLDLL
ncbi:MAG: phospholipid carrier-dependent glycosyltransferase, partial [Candidatus Eremiobacteraeota bacterium]|nr:phospholipid carrier-dependent glycosyltransferase [Candidatus Eremiobacteraeota bacterium]